MIAFADTMAPEVAALVRGKQPKIMRRPPVVKQDHTCVFCGSSASNFVRRIKDHALLPVCRNCLADCRSARLVYRG